MARQRELLAQRDRQRMGGGELGARFSETQACPHGAPHSLNGGSKCTLCACMCVDSLLGYSFLDSLSPLASAAPALDVTPPQLFQRPHLSGPSQVA